jgi:hypothetical protein
MKIAESNKLISLGALFQPEAIMIINFQCKHLSGTTIKSSEERIVM